MGWRERDWARFNRHERRVFFGDGDLPRSADTPRARVGRRRVSRRARLAVVGVCGALVGVLAGVYQVPDRAAAATREVAHFAHQRLGSPTSHPAQEIRLREHTNWSQSVPPEQPPSKPTRTRVSIRWRASEVVPAQVGGRICVTPRGRRQVCATYVVGERPADNLTRRLRVLGYQVQSFGG
jgi:hypothetical protein